MVRRIGLLVVAAGVLLGGAATGWAQTVVTERLIASTQVAIGSGTAGAGPLRVAGLTNASTANVLVVDGSGDVTYDTSFPRRQIAESITAAWSFTADPIRYATTGQANIFLGDRGDGSDAQRLRLSYDFTAARGVVNAYNDATAAYLPLRVDGNTLGLNLGSQADVEFGADALPEAAYSGNVGSLTRKWLTIHAAELWVQTLVAQDVLSTIGGRILALPTTVLAADLADGAGDTTITVKHNNLASGDRIYLEANGKVEFMAVTSGAGGSAGAYTYSVTRDLDTSGRNLWYAGDAVANTGTTGDGWIDLYSVRGVASGGYGPAIVGNERLSATYNDWEPRWAIGNLNGVYGYSADTYGAAFGDDDASNLVIDATNGIRFRNGTTVLGSWSGSTITLGQPLTANNTGQVVIDSDSVDVNWRNNSGVTSTLFRVYNYGGSGAAEAGGWRLRTDNYLTTTSDGAAVIGVSGTTSTLTLYTPTAGGVVVDSGTMRPASNGSATSGTSSERWSTVYGNAYYVGTTAGVSGTCASVTVVNGIVTGCTP